MIMLIIINDVDGDDHVLISRTSLSSQSFTDDSGVIVCDFISFIGLRYVMRESERESERELDSADYLLFNGTECKLPRLIYL